VASKIMQKLVREALEHGSGQSQNRGGTTLNRLVRIFFVSIETNHLNLIITKRNGEGAIMFNGTAVFLHPNLKLYSG
jgi:hypothetical protein